MKEHPMRRIKNLWTKIKAIHTSRVEFREELTDRQIERLKICSMCKYNSDNSEKHSITTKIFIFLNRLLNEVYGLRVLIDAVCTVCGCQIVHLTTQEEVENKCKKKKW